MGSIHQTFTEDEELLGCQMHNNKQDSNIQQTRSRRKWPGAIYSPMPYFSPTFRWTTGSLFLDGIWCSFSSTLLVFPLGRLEKCLGSWLERSIGHGLHSFFQNWKKSKRWVKKEWRRNAEGEEALYTDKKKHCFWPIARINGTKMSG